MCSESSDVSEAAEESSAENFDEASELCENNENEASAELIENDDKSEESDNPVPEASDKDNTQMEDSEKDKEAVRAEINEKSEYSAEVNERISSVEELEVYQKANLREETVDGRTCLVRDDIAPDYYVPKEGMTNRELMGKGRAPYDPETGEIIVLHHIGQEADSPLAELTEGPEHESNYSVLHTKEGESWRMDAKKSNRYNNTERPGHWRCRKNGG